MNSLSATAVSTCLSVASTQCSDSDSSVHSHDNIQPTLPTSIVAPIKPFCVEMSANSDSMANGKQMRVYQQPKPMQYSAKDLLRLRNSLSPDFKDRKHLAELEQELAALDSLCAANLLNQCAPGFFVRQHNYMNNNFEHSRKLLLREISQLRFRLSVVWAAEAARDTGVEQQQYQSPAMPLKINNTSPRTPLTPFSTAASPPSLRELCSVDMGGGGQLNQLSTTPWSQMLIKSTPTSRNPNAEVVKSGKRPFRPDLEDQFSAMTITESGLIHMSVKVPFPDSAIDNEGKCQNLIGRILGPRGISVRQLEIQYGCKILIRGKGSIKDAAKEKRLRGKPEGRHLEEKLHVLIEAQEPSRDSCIRKLTIAKRFIEKLMVPVFDEYKRQQLIQLAIINGTYRSRVRKDIGVILSKSSPGSSV